MEKTKKIKTIINNLKKSKKVNSFNDGDEFEYSTLAHSFLDMEDSCKLLLNKYFPKFLKDNIDEEEIDETLFDIGEELRHILYHINDPKFYKYLRNDNSF
jgi:hypothetical protein